MPNTGAFLRAQWADSDANPSDTSRVMRHRASAKPVFAMYLVIIQIWFGADITATELNQA